MYVRCGYFEGEVAPEDQERFRAHLETVVAPLMARMPGIRSLRLLWGDSFEDGAPHYHLVIEHGYDSPEALQAALASDIRHQMRDRLAEVLPLFKGRIFHVNCHASALPGQR